MPFTPYHFGPALLFCALLFLFIDVATIMIASILLDFEPLIVLIFGLPLPLHGFFHTYLGATIIALILSAMVWPFCAYLNQIIILFGLHQKSNLHHIILASLIGTYFHIFLDSFLYMEINPFYPVLGNPFLGLVSSGFIYAFCVISASLGIVACIFRILYSHNRVADSQLDQDAFA